MYQVLVYKDDLKKAIDELTRGMQEVNWFMNLRTKPYKKDINKVWIILG